MKDEFGPMNTYCHNPERFGLRIDDLPESPLI